MYWGKAKNLGNAYPQPMSRQVRIDMNDRKTETDGLTLDLLCEKVITGEKVGESPLGIARPAGYVPGRSATLKGAAAKFRSRNEPHSLVWSTQKRGDEARQEHESFGQDGRRCGELEKILNDEVE